MIAALVLFLTASACERALGPGEFVNESLVLSSDSTYNAETCGPGIYPCPPYGVRQYQTLRDIPFLPANPISHEIAGPDGIARLRYFHQMVAQGYKLLLISNTTGWCELCGEQMLIAPLMVDQFGMNATAPIVAFLNVVTEDSSLNAASLEVASQYSTDHGLDHLVPHTNDQNGYFRELMTSAYSPINIFVDLKTMKIIGYESALYTESLFFNKLNEMLAFVNK